jgi:hypothetical protein
MNVGKADILDIKDLLFYNMTMNSGTTLSIQNIG